MLVGTGSVEPAHTDAGRIGRPVPYVVKRSSCRSIMLRQEQLAFIKANSTLQQSPALLRELRMALSRKKKSPVVPAGRRGTASGGEAGAYQRPSRQLAGKRKANELGSSVDSFEPANRRPAAGAGSAPLPAISPVKGELAAVGSRQLGPPEGEMTYTAALAGPVAPFQPSGSLKPTAMGSHLSEPALIRDSQYARV
jgi:hypothetical protein